LTTVGLAIIFLLVLTLPFLFHRVEKNLELFLFAMGLAAAVLGGALNGKLALLALKDPLPITAAVLGMGFLFRFTRGLIERGVKALLTRVPVKLFVFAVILALGVVSSVLTVIIASLILVEVVSLLKLDRRSEVRIVVLACFALGLGAVLTPIGEPLSTLAVSKLSGPPYHAGFWFLLTSLGLWILPGILGFALLSLFFHDRPASSPGESLEESAEEVVRDESYRDIFLRAGKVYLFVVALVLLGEGFKPVIDRYVVTLPAPVLYWLNMSSAVLDNATLTAAELSPAMAMGQIRDVLLGLLIAGGMLIPGNIPNIIAASKLRIGMKEWARFGVPVGLAVMLIYFVLLLVF